MARDDRSFPVSLRELFRSHCGVIPGIIKGDRRRRLEMIRDGPDLGLCIVRSLSVAFVTCAL